MKISNIKIPPLRYALVGMTLTILVYTVLWFYAASVLNREIESVFAGAKENDIVFNGEIPRVKNYPFPPEIQYTGGIEMGDAKLIFPVMVLKGYPIAGTGIDMIFPQGVSIGGIVDPKIWTADYFSTNIIIPKKFPRSVMEDDIATWQAAGGALTIPHYEFRKGSLISTGRGDFGLDGDLQPVFHMDSVIKNFEAYIEELKAQRLLESFPAAIGVTMLNSLASIDPETGEKIVNLRVSVRSQILTVGPLQVLELPLFSWGKRMPPVPHQ